MALLDVAEKYDLKVNLVGGGYKGQAEALRLAIARALVKINAEDKSARDSKSANVNPILYRLLIVFSIQTAKTCAASAERYLEVA